jgi:hypothetical protein
MKINEHQQKLWRKMINLIMDYLNGETDDFYGVVGKLEGALDASEIQDIALINQWYDLWTPLEIRRSIEGNNINKEEALKELTKMKNFLESVLQNTY